MKFIFLFHVIFVDIFTEKNVIQEITSIINVWAFCDYYKEMNGLESLMEYDLVSDLSCYIVTLMQWYHLFVQATAARRLQVCESFDPRRAERLHGAGSGLAVWNQRSGISTGNYSYLEKKNGVGMT